MPEDQRPSSRTLWITSAFFMSPMAMAMIGNPGLIQFGSSSLIALFALEKVELGLGMISYGAIVPIRWLVWVI